MVMKAQCANFRPEFVFDCKQNLTEKKFNGKKIDRGGGLQKVQYILITCSKNSTLLFPMTERMFPKIALILDDPHSPDSWPSQVWLKHWKSWNNFPSFWNKKCMDKNIQSKNGWLLILILIFALGTIYTLGCRTRSMKVDMELTNSKFKAAVFSRGLPCCLTHKMNW